MCEINFFKQVEKCLFLSWFERKQILRKKVFTSHWMTTDTNFAMVKRTEKETTKKEKIKKKSQQ